MQTAKQIQISGITAPERPSAIADPFAAVRCMRAAVWVYDIDNSRIVYANTPACYLWQADNEEMLVGRDLGEDMSSTVAKRLKQYQTDFTERDSCFSEMWTLYPNGEPASVMMTFSGYPLPDGRMGMICEVVQHAEDLPENLRSAEALLHTDVMIMLYELHGPPLYLNPAARNLVNEVAECLSDKFVELEVYHDMIFQLEAEGEYRMVVNVHTENGKKWYDLSAKKCSDAATGKPAILVTAVDVSDLKIARDKARYLAERDQLTGCYNRAYLQQYLAMLNFDQSERCALLYFDLDRFKQINDRYGHVMGDNVLKEVASRARAAIRKNDIIVRLGGDEFVIVFENAETDLDLAPHIDRLMDAISQPFQHDSTRLNVTVSMGVATFAPGDVDFAEILREADVALYASKQAGRNRVTLFNSEMGSAAKARGRIELELKRAIENREFVLYFQPRLDLNTGNVISAEALVRWEHPTRGIVMPGEFIPVCEETGMIEELGRLIVDMGCTQVLAWQKAGLDIELSLNISPRQFNDKHLMHSLETFSEHPLFPRDKVELEITENVLIGDHDPIEKKLEAISKMGYRIAIDDFGTGYSNLSYISRFPLNCLKIDQSFINQLPKTGPIISLILTLAKQINATVVAEGVETSDQLNWLRHHHCCQVQGYFLSRPVPISEFEATLAQLAETCGENFSRDTAAWRSSVF